MPHDRLQLRGLRRHAARLPRRSARQEQQPNRKGPAPELVPGFHLGYRARVRHGTGMKVIISAHINNPTGYFPRLTARPTAQPRAPAQHQILWSYFADPALGWGTG
jgi:hypothetical protein